jgi:sigma54-dependent transcription regulator
VIVAGSTIPTIADLLYPNPRCSRRRKATPQLLLIGPSGVGKSWLACALGHKACREDLSVAYHRVPRLFAALALARGDGRYSKLLKSLAEADLLIRFGRGAHWGALSGAGKRRA